MIKLYQKRDFMMFIFSQGQGGDWILWRSLQEVGESIKFNCQRRDWRKEILENFLFRSRRSLYFLLNN
jgi:hypothetical protein